MSDSQLRELIQTARETLRERITRQLEEFRSLAREAGFEVSLTRIGEESVRRRRRSGEAGDGADRRGAVAAKYRNPDNTAETWSGRGRKPKWIEEQLGRGVSLESLAIREAGAQAA